MLPAAWKSTCASLRTRDRWGRSAGRERWGALAAFHGPGAVWSVIVTVATFVAMVPVASAQEAVAAQPPAVQEITYEAFVSLDDEDRRATFTELPPERKSAFKRERARRWVEANQAILSPRQLAAMERAIAFLSPRLYASRPSDADRQAEAALQRELECSLGRERVYEAFTFFEPVRGERTIGHIVDEWLFWFDNCLGE